MMSQKWTPTTAAPGSPEKVRVLGERARAWLPLFHPLDADGNVDQFRKDLAADLRRFKKKPHRSVQRGRYIYGYTVGAFIVRVTRNGVRHELGYFRRYEDAVKARDTFLRERGEMDGPSRHNRYIYLRKSGNPGKPYFVKVALNGEQHYVGVFNTIEEARRARDAFLRRRGELELVS